MLYVDQVTAPLVTRVEFHCGFGPTRNRDHQPKPACEKRVAFDQNPARRIPPGRCDRRCGRETYRRAKFSPRHPHVARWQSVLCRHCGLLHTRLRRMPTCRQVPCWLPLTTTRPTGSIFAVARRAGGLRETFANILLGLLALHVVAVIAISLPTRDNLIRAFKPETTGRHRIPVSRAPGHPHRSPFRSRSSRSRELLMERCGSTL
ncbi:hypothetical protein BH10PSE15_BH10PSE15_08710 [soil metagenome]